MFTWHTPFPGGRKPGRELKHRKNRDSLLPQEDREREQGGRQRVKAKRLHFTQRNLSQSVATGV